MHRQIESKKAEKLQSSLHMIDLPKQNKHIHFVANLDELKQPSEEVNEPVVVNQSSKLEQEIRHIQSQNKQQYKRLADAIGKSD